MCSEAKRLFEEYCTALSKAVPSESSASEHRVRTAMSMLTDHNIHHRCCAKLRFEHVSADSRWRLTRITPAS
jgi:hypothetical protein